MSNAKKTILAVVLLAVLGSYFYYVEYQGAARRADQEVQAKKLLPDLTQDHIASFSILRGSEKITCIKTNGKWSVTVPRTVPGDAKVLDSWCKTLSSMPRQETIDEAPTDVAPYGLTAPALIVDASTLDGKRTVQVQFGAFSPTRAMNYVRVAGSKTIFGVPAHVLSGLNKTVFELRDKTILSLDLQTIRKITVDHSKGRIVLEKTGDDWFVRQPVDLRARTVRVNQLINDVSFGSVKEFTQEPLTTPGKFGLDHPQRTITYEGEGRRQWLSIGKKKQGVYYASRSGVSDCIQVYEYLGNNIPVSPGDIEEKRMFDPQNWNVERFEVEGKGGGLQAVLKDGGLYAPGGDKKPDLDFFSGSVQNLEYLKRMKAGAVPLRITGLDQPQARYIFTLKDKQEPSILQIGNAVSGGQGLYAKTSREPQTLYVISADILGKVPRLQSVPTPVPAQR